MRSESWFRRFWARLWSGMVQDVPPSLEECETCRDVDCTEERWHYCARRLAAEAANLSANAPGRTNELLPRVPPDLPYLPADHTPEPASEEPSAPLRTRKISNH